MKIVNLNINDFGGIADHRKEYKNIFNNKYLKEWDKLDKSNNIDGIFQYLKDLASKPDIIVLQEFDINSKEATDFKGRMEELGYILASEDPSKRASMTVFFIAKGINYKSIKGIHERNLRAYAVKLCNDYIVYGTHVPPKYDEAFWDELDCFIKEYRNHKLVLIGDFNTINVYNKSRLEALLNKTGTKDVWFEKGNINPISIPGDYAFVSETIKTEDVEIEISPIEFSDHPVIMLSLP